MNKYILVVETHKGVPEIKNEFFYLDADDYLSECNEIAQVITEVFSTGCYQISSNCFVLWSKLGPKEIIDSLTDNFKTFNPSYGLKTQCDIILSPFNELFYTAKREKQLAIEKIINI